MRKGNESDLYAELSAKSSRKISNAKLRREVTQAIGDLDKIYKERIAPIAANRRLSGSVREASIEAASNIRAAMKSLLDLEDKIR